MAEQMTSYQCPSCNAPLHFDPQSQKLKCDSCGNTYTIEEISKYFDEANQEAVSIDAEAAQTEAAGAMQWSEEEASHMRAYHCPACGARLITDDTTAATSCPYCGNPQIIPAQFEGALRPDSLIPFHLQKQDAVDALNRYYQGKPFLPSAFKEQNHIEEIKGVYVPFWLYDAHVHTNLQYSGERAISTRHGDDIVTITSHYAIGRQSDISFEKVPADASSTMPDELMDSIEPFDYKDLKKFDLSYLPGFLANRYDVDAEKDSKRADTRMTNTALDATRSTIHGYTALLPIRENTSVKPGTVWYTLLPVWMLSTRYQGKNYLFAMNGQTGKMIGDDLPVDWKKFFLTFFLITAAGMGILYLILFVFMGGAS
jgi:DNA-directed RNA polymerase subunit RPC12/RpoP